MKTILQEIVADPHLHAAWLNTLSFMENAGARKISACEHPIKTQIIQLKHAAEEHRHAYYLKKQLSKLEVKGFEDYADANLLAARSSKQYLARLDLLACRYLKEQFSLADDDLRYAAYLFVTYAIEVRADELYPIYQELLSAAGSKVNVKSIILEEEGHLEEMISQLQAFDSDWEKHAQEILKLESSLFEFWIAELRKHIFPAVNEHEGSLG
ncbi:hypothetical protein [Sphingobacterium sp. CZ-2]|uniref:hypothetical protein n=1 Tax=Sphingobacterium sp. CZ-2 TaxID=2557994 RepID=UPI00107000A1|nr:hypothetical protein [Sphingobacterium sp. CZ-2]QBR13180.1 hypothetical protein E3D81_13805 [Sphingobacterium sp. CZ-2]